MSARHNPAIIDLARRRASEAEGTVAVVDTSRGLVGDGWVNLTTGLGNALRDKRLAATFNRSSLLQQPELDALYAGDWLIARACDRPAADQVRRWIDVKVDGKKGSDDDITQALDDLDIKAKFAEAITWSRLHGGALIILGIEDGGAPEEPVNPKRIRGITWANVVDRWDATVWRYYSEQGIQRYGQPELYQLVTSVVAADGSMLGRVFHETRCLRIDGVLTSRRARLENNGWNHGVVQRVYDTVRDFHTALGGAAHLTADFAQAVLKIKGLAKMFAEDKDDLVRTRLVALDFARSVTRMVPIDEEESFERVATPISGLAELLDRLRDAVCGATDIPEKILFGKATAGLGDQGQSDLEQYYNQIAGEQERNVVPQLGRLVTYLYAANGSEPKRWHIKPRHLWDLSDTEVSEIRKRDAETDQTNITTGLYTAEEARKSRFGGDGYGREIVIETDDADLDGIKSAAPDDTRGPEEVKEVTGIVINAATDIVAKVVAGELPIPAARVLLKAALRLEEPDIDAMLEGVEQERERRQAMAATIAAGTGGEKPPAAGAPQDEPAPDDEDEDEEKPEPENGND